MRKFRERKGGKITYLEYNKKQEHHIFQRKFQLSFLFRMKGHWKAFFMKRNGILGYKKTGNRRVDQQTSDKRTGVESTSERFSYIWSQSVWWEVDVFV